MTRLLLALLAATALNCADPAPLAPPYSSEPPGSSLSGGRICFQRETPDGWVPVGLVDAAGAHPVRYTAAAGYWYFPADAGRVRVIPNCWAEQQK